MLLSVFLLRFVDSRAENFFGIFAPLSIVTVIVFIIIDNLRREKDGRH